MGSDSGELLQVRDLSLDYLSRQGAVHALNKVSLSLQPSQMLGIVGESGSGKSTLAYAIIRLLPPNAVYRSGKVIFDGTSILDLPENRLKGIRGKKISMVFQDPMTSLNPLFRVKDQLGRVLELHRGVSKVEARRLALECLKSVELPDPEQVLESYPFQLSGGMQQRVMIAMALSTQPDLIMADEPTSAVDATIQVQILELLSRLKREHAFSMLFITHSLDVVSVVCDSVAVMYAGSVVETGKVSDIFSNPKHPYTQALFSAIPRPRRSTSEPKQLQSIKGNVPDLRSIPSGCKFHPRCPFAFDRCKVEDPAFRAVAPRHEVACHLY
ncbi:MAG: ABC transporter ATP-binding protein [Nitrososphaerales archaeon]|nr:ABC transporter ATP-binding protein [Nitrososphaerales archaeon]